MVRSVENFDEHSDASFFGSHGELLTGDVGPIESEGCSGGGMEIGSRL